MTNLLDKAANFLQDEMEDHASTGIKYVRAGLPFVAMVAIPGQIVVDQVDASGFALRMQTRDFVIRQSYFVGLGEPERNDEIRQLINGKTYVFFVNGDGFSTSHFEATDAYGVAYRIHTRLDRIE